MFKILLVALLVLFVDSQKFYMKNIEGTSFWSGAFELMWQEVKRFNNAPISFPWFFLLGDTETAIKSYDNSILRSTDIKSSRYWYHFEESSKFKSTLAKKLNVSENQLPIARFDPNRQR